MTILPMRPGLVTRRELLIVVIVTAILSVFSNLLESLSDFRGLFHSYDHFELDELLTALSCGVLGLLILSVRRERVFRRGIGGREASDQLSRQSARHEALTGLPNGGLQREERMDATVPAGAMLETDLRAAVSSGAIIPHFQPIIELGEGRIIGFEALARWAHPTRGMMQPDAFIPIAEDLGIIHEITNAMLRASSAAARDWPPELWVSVNISPSQLKEPWLALRLLAILAETGLKPGRLIIEVTENAMIDDLACARQTFLSLQNAGVRIALDDFGKGYSSLYHLRQLRFDHLKIDGSFVQSMDCVESFEIVAAVAGLGKSLGMAVTAEGVQTAAEADAVRGIGCDLAQGFLFGKPLSAAGTLALLNAGGDFSIAA